MAPRHTAGDCPWDGSLQEDGKSVASYDYNVEATRTRRRTDPCTGAQMRNHLVASFHRAAMIDLDPRASARIARAAERRGAKAESPGRASGPGLRLQGRPA